MSVRRGRPARWCTRRVTVGDPVGEPLLPLRVMADEAFIAVPRPPILPHSATPADVATIYRSAWERGLKGITIYRYGSLGQQVLELGLDETGQDREHFTRCDPHACKL